MIGFATWLLGCDEFCQNHQCKRKEIKIQVTNKENTYISFYGKNKQFWVTKKHAEKACFWCRRRDLNPQDPRVTGF